MKIQKVKQLIAPQHFKIWALIHISNNSANDFAVCDPPKSALKVGQETQVRQCCEVSLPSCVCRSRTQCNMLLLDIFFLNLQNLFFCLWIIKYNLSLNYGFITALLKTFE